MGGSILEFFGIYTLKQKGGAILGVLVLLLVLVGAYYYFTMPKENAAALKPVPKKVSGSQLAALLEEYKISVFDSDNTTALYLPSAWDIGNDLDWATLNTACGMTQFDLRRFGNNWANLTVYVTDSADIENGKPILLHVITVNESIACAYKTTEGRPDDRYGLSQVLGTWAK